MQTNTPTPKPRPFLVEYLIIIGIDTLIVFAVSLIFGGTSQVSNFYFLSSLVLLIIAAVPAFSEVGGNFRVIGRVSKGEKMADILHNQEAVGRSGARTSYLFGLAAITAFILAFIFI
jgi:hypothetical protein